MKPFRKVLSFRSVSDSLLGKSQNNANHASSLRRFQKSQKSERLTPEQLKAAQVSKEIDKQIEQDKKAAKKGNKITLLLLGQSESGKSTTLKHFQRLYAPNAFREERLLWLQIIQLNILRSVRIIIDAISHQSSALVSDDDDDLSDTGGGPSARSPLPPRVGLTRDIDERRARLRTLKIVEMALISALVPESEQEATMLPQLPPPSTPTRSYGSAGSDKTRVQMPKKTQEVSVRGGEEWKKLAVRPTNGKGKERSHSSSSFSFDEPPQVVLNQHWEDIKYLWTNQTVRDILKRRKIRMEEFPGFFLDDIERVTAVNYIPDDHDVLKARLKTIGISEHVFKMEAAAGNQSGSEWKVIDVGGSRSLRSAWVPFFDNVNAIIFLAPISAFNQVLIEDRSINRLEDSVLLWKAVCSNKLLENVDIVLFLNKCDLLKQKLDSGIRLSKYVRSYGERDNDMSTAIKFFTAKFGAIQREFSPIPRRFYSFCTSVTDTTTTTGILASVYDIISRQHLKEATLI